jgi:hypothetical protein
MTYWWLPWFFGALSISLAVLFIGSRLKPRRKQPEPETTDMFWSREYRQMYSDCLNYAERIYQK